MIPSSRILRLRAAGTAISVLAFALASHASAQVVNPSTIDKAANPATTQAAPDTATGPVGPAAQQQAATTEEDSAQIIVTGSRIGRPTLDSPIPVSTISAADLTHSGDTNIGDVLDKISPQLAPTYTQANSTQFIGTSGLNILDLRNLGPDRTLVLVDGQRHITSSEGDFFVDVNTIPNDLIDRVDVVTGGSSAVYGSDAMAGVVNFVMKQHYSGAEFNLQSGITSQGDRANYKASALLGKNFDNDRGNIAIYGEYDQANALYNTERPNETGAYAGRNQFQLVNNPNAGNGLPDRTFLTGIHSFGYSNGGTFIPYSGGSIRDCGVVAAACLPNGFPRVFLFQPDGNLTEANYGTDFRPVGSGNNQGGSGSTLEDTGVLDPGYKRYIFNLLAHYDFSDAFRPYVNAKFARIISTQVSGPTFSQGGDQGAGAEPFNYYTLTPIQLDNAFLTPQAKTLITSLLDPGSTFFNLNRNNVDLGSRGEDDRRDTYRIVGGVQGTFNHDWHYNLAADYGRLNTQYAFTNNRIEQNFYNSIDAVYNNAGQIVCRINQVTVTDPNCAPIDILGNFGTQQTAAQRQAALNYFNTTSHRYGHASELDVNLNLDGNTSELFSLPGGPIRFSLGAEYRRETAAYHYDDLVTSGATFLNSIAPFNPPSFVTKEAFGELDAPIIRDKPFFNELSLSGAGRVAHYKGATGTVYAYNGGAVYAPVQDVRFRFNYSHSVRAPTLDDLYSSDSQDYASVDDPCDVDFINTGKPTRAANCLAAGVPVGYVNSVARAGSIAITDGGNPNLKAETSRSLTYGVILQPSFVPGLAVTVDYYDIKISNVISAVDAQTILNGCYDGATLNNQFCSLIAPRQSNGDFNLQSALLQSTLNYSAERAKGIDLDVAYNHRFGDENKLALRFVGSWVRQNTDYPYLDDPTEPLQIKGTQSEPVYRFHATVDYTYKKLTLGYALTYVGKQSITDYDAQHVVADDPGSPFNPLYADISDYPAEFYHDVRVSYEVGDHYSIYAGVDNLLDQLPPLGLLGTGLDALYDNVGRQLYLGVKVKM